MTETQPRNIVILCDGTGKNGDIDGRNGQPITNIWRLYEAIKGENRAGKHIIEYFPGVGADNEKPTTGDLLARTFGHTAVASIRRIYRTIAENYNEGDSLSLFGYSRGAFIVRKVASLIGKIGLITDEQEFTKYWKGLEHKLPGLRRTPRLPPNPRLIPISCLGVWDTVGAVRPLVIREQLNLLTLPDNDLPDIVQSALHVIAYHENRKLFDVVLFDKERGRERCNEMLFPGCHSDVGGGAEKENVLSDVTLDWMLDAMPSTIKALKRHSTPQFPGPYKLNDAFHTSPLWKRIPDRLMPREHLKPMMVYLKRHTTMDKLPRHNSSYLLDHSPLDGEAYDVIDRAEVEPVADTKPCALPVPSSQTKRPTLVTDGTEKSNEVTFPALSPAPASSNSEWRGSLHGRPSGLSSRQDSILTQHTDMSLSTQLTVSTPRTSVVGDSPLLGHPSLLPTIKDDSKGEGYIGEIPDAPETPVVAAKPVELPAPAPAPLDEKTAPVEQPIAAPQQAPVPQQVQPMALEGRPRARKPSFMRRVGRFLKKAACCG